MSSISRSTPTGKSGKKHPVTVRVSSFSLSVVNPPTITAIHLAAGDYTLTIDADDLAHMLRPSADGTKSNFARMVDQTKPR